jgi:integrase
MIGAAQIGKSPLLTKDIRKIVRACPRTLAGPRDKALVLTGFTGAFRRSELARIEVSDLTFNKNGVVIDPRVSKTDQEGAGRKVGLPFGKNKSTCPVRALRAWLKASRVKHGPVFRRVDRSGIRHGAAVLKKIQSAKC